MPGTTEAGIRAASRARRGTLVPTRTSARVSEIGASMMIKSRGRVPSAQRTRGDGLYRRRDARNRPAPLDRKQPSLDAGTWTIRADVGLELLDLVALSSFARSATSSFHGGYRICSYERGRC